MNAPLLILDLDETLLSACEDESQDHDFTVFSYYVTKRPYLEEFLDRVRGWFNIAVWTSSGDEYASQIVPHVFGDTPMLEFVWAASRCTVRLDPEQQALHAIKDLKKVKKRGYHLDRVLVIDDSPEKLARNFGNYLRVKPFEGDRNDRELLDVLPFLEWIVQQPNFRAVDKRAWQDPAGLPYRQFTTYKRHPTPADAKSSC